MSWKCRHCPKEVVHIRVPLKNEGFNFAAKLAEEYQEYRQWLSELGRAIKEYKPPVENNTKGFNK